VFINRFIIESISNNMLIPICNQDTFINDRHSVAPDLVRSAIRPYIQIIFVFYSVGPDCRAGRFNS